MRKIRSKTIHEEAAAQIRGMIRDGLLAKGQKIDEKYLCLSMGVSRTPVRESLKLLNAEGLVILIPNKGAYVSDPPVEEIQELFEVVSVLEGTAARLAAKKITEIDLSKMKALHQDLEHHYRASDHKTYLHRNNILHVFIQDIAGNKVLKQVIEGLKQKVLIYRHRQLYEEDRFNRSIREHREILEAFRKRDAVMAERAMRQHLMNQYKALIHGSLSERSGK